MSAPTVARVIQENGEINDELDYALMNYLLRNRGGGFTACQPSLVELSNGTQAIKMGIDNTFLSKNNQEIRRCGSRTTTSSKRKILIFINRSSFYFLLSKNVE